MNTPKRGLGKGLDALLATSAKAQARVDMNVERQEAYIDGVASLKRELEVREKLSRK